MIFNSKPKITQYFAANPQFYAQYDLFGHEGIDLVPTGKEWTVYSWMHGVVMRRYASSVYGETIIIHERKSGLSWRIAHLGKVFVNEGDRVEFDTKLGVMGNTPSGRAGIGGKPMEAHLHINCIPMFEYTTDESKRDFYRNGFKGRVDPLGVLRERGEV